MKLDVFLFLLALAIISDTVACAIGSYTVLKANGNPTMRRLGIALFGLFFETACQLAAYIFGFVHKPEYTVGFGVAYWSGRVVRSITLWMLVLHIVGYRRKVSH